MNFKKCEYFYLLQKSIDYNLDQTIIKIIQIENLKNILKIFLKK